VRALALMESMLKYRSYPFRDLTSTRNPGGKQCLVGSLTGVVASQIVTEAFKGSLKTNRNRRLSVNAQESLTVRPTSRADAKAGVSDPVVPNGRAIAQWIKGTPGITGLSPLRVHIDEEVWHLDVGSTHPGAGEGPKGLAVRQLKRYVIWVQTVARQVGPYPSWA
jgi:hypothetical protein